MSEANNNTENTETSINATQKVQSQSVNIKTDSLPSSGARRIFRRKTKKTKSVPEDVIKDDREPQITLFSHLKMLQIFSWNLIFVGIGAFCA